MSLLVLKQIPRLPGGLLLPWKRQIEGGRRRRSERGGSSEENKMEKRQEEGKRKDGGTARNVKGQRAGNKTKDVQGKKLQMVRVRGRLLGLKQRVEV